MAEKLQYRSMSLRGEWGEWKDFEQNESMSFNNPAQFRVKPPRTEQEILDTLRNHFFGFEPAGETRDALLGYARFMMKVLDGDF